MTYEEIAKCDLVYETQYGRKTEMKSETFAKERGVNPFPKAYRAFLLTCIKHLGKRITIELNVNDKLGYEVTIAKFDGLYIDYGKGMDCVYIMDEARKWVE